MSFNPLCSITTLQTEPSPSHGVNVRFVPSTDMMMGRMNDMVISPPGPGSSGLGPHNPDGRRRRESRPGGDRDDRGLHDRHARESSRSRDRNRNPDHSDRNRDSRHYPPHHNTAKSAKSHQHNAFNSGSEIFYSIFFMRGYSPLYSKIPGSLIYF